MNHRGRCSQAFPGGQYRDAFNRPSAEVPRATSLLTVCGQDRRWPDLLSPLGRSLVKPTVCRQEHELRLSQRRVGGAARIVLGLLDLSRDLSWQSLRRSPHSALPRGSKVTQGAWRLPPVRRDSWSIPALCIRAASVEHDNHGATSSGTLDFTFTPAITPMRVVPSTL